MGFINILNSKVFKEMGIIILKMATWAVKTKIDWFIDNIFKQQFNSYRHAADFFSDYFKEDINDYDIKRVINGKFDKFRRIEVYKINELVPFKVFKSNLEFMDFFKMNHPSNVSRIINNNNLKDHIIKIIYISPDIRLYKEEEIKRKCTCCNQVKDLNVNFFHRVKDEFKTRCKLCHINKVKSKPDNLDQDWKSHPDFTNYYFERDTTKIYNIETGKYIIANPVIDNKERLICNLKWEAFYGKIPENKIIKFKNELTKVNDPDHSELDNLDCIYVYCNTCEKMIESPKSIDQVFCSKICQRKTIQKRQKNERNNNIIKYIRHKLYTHKIINKKYNTKVDYDLEYLSDMGNVCYYCEINCKFGNEKEDNHPDTLTFDKKNPDIGYIKDNIVVCCWFCNRMKNQTTFNDWEKFINFIKNDNVLELDLSDKEFARTSTEINISNIVWHIKQKSPSYYSIVKEAKETFKDLCKKQNYLDPFFNFFPVINLGTNCLFNASIDAIDSTLPEEEKHRPDNIQVLPKCFNYGKNILSNEEFLNQWKFRKFKTNFENCSVKLPEEYYSESYFEKFLK